MNARIGAARSVNTQGGRENFFERCFDLPLDRILPVLKLPSGIVGAVVLQCEFYLHRLFNCFSSASMGLQLRKILSIQEHLTITVRRSILKQMLNYQERRQERLDLAFGALSDPDPSRHRRATIARAGQRERAGQTAAYVAARRASASANSARRRIDEVGEKGPRAMVSAGSETSHYRSRMDHGAAKYVGTQPRSPGRVSW